MQERPRPVGSSYLRMSAFLPSAQREAGASGPTGVPAWSHTRVRDALVALAPSKDEDAAIQVRSCGNTRGSPCSFQLTETAAIRHRRLPHQTQRLGS